MPRCVLSNKLAQMLKHTPYGEVPRRVDRSRVNYDNTHFYVGDEHRDAIADDAFYGEHRGEHHIH